MAHRIKRREFMAIAAGSATWPMTGSARSGATPQHVVVLSAATDAVTRLSVLRERLAASGYVEGRDIVLDIRSAEGHPERLSALAEALVQEGGVDAILAISTPAAFAARRATQTTPIVAIVGVDPVESGLVSSFAHTGGNVTGIAILADEVNAKRVELIRQLAPHAVRLAAVTAIVGGGSLNIDSVRQTGRKLGFDVGLIVVNPDHLREALGPSAVAGVDAFVFVPDVVLLSRRDEVVGLISQTRKPAIFAERDWVDSGGLVSYGPDFKEITSRWTTQVIRVLRGEKPEDLPFERPTKLELRVNLRAARTMGIEIPSMLLARADEVIE